MTEPTQIDPIHTEQRILELCAQNTDGINDQILQQNIFLQPNSFAKIKAFGVVELRPPCRILMIAKANSIILSPIYLSITYTQRLPSKKIERINN